MLRLTSLIALGAMMWIFQLLVVAAAPEAQATLALGFLVLAAYLGGLLAQQMHLPKITGYLITGAVTGPAGLHFVTEQDVGNLTLIGEVAVALIALAAGGALRMRDLRDQRAMLIRFGGAALAFPALAVGIGVLVVSAWFPLTAGRGPAQALAVGLLAGVVMAAGSPAVVLAVLSETGAKGTLARTVLTVAVAKDVAVIVCFAVAISLARGLTGAEGATFGLGAAIERLVLSVGSGVLLGWLTSQYVRHVERQMVLFTMGVAFLAVEAARSFGLDAMLVTLTAGFFIENIAPVRGERFVRALEQSSLPIYAVFFALAGAGVHVDALRTMWPWALLFVALRGAGLVWAARWGARSDQTVATYGWTGLVSQAGVALGLAVVIGGTLGDWGRALETLVVAVIALHELFGPVVFRWGLVRAKEVSVDDAVRSADEIPAPAG